MAQFEKEYLTRLVGRAGGNMSKAARLASIDRTTLYRLMDKHSFQRDELTRGRLSEFRSRSRTAHRTARPGATPLVRSGSVRAGTVARALARGARQAVLEADAAVEAAPASRRHRRGDAAAASRDIGSAVRSGLAGATPASALPRARVLARAPAGAAARSPRWPCSSAGPRRSTRSSSCASLRRVERVQQTPRARLVPALRRPALGPRRARAGGRGGPRPPLAAHLDPLPRRDAAARPQRPRQPGAGAPARPHLQRRLRAQLVASDVIELARGGDRLVDLDPIPVLRSPTSSSRSATSCSRSPRRRASRSGSSPPDADFRVGPSGRAEPGAAQPDHQRAQVHRRGLSSRCAAASRDGTRVEFSVRDTGRGIPPQAMAHAVRAVPPAAEAGRVRLLRLRARTLHLPQAGRGDALHPAGRNRAGAGHPLLLRARPSRVSHGGSDRAHDARLLHVVGARPNFMKVAPVLRARAPRPVEHSPRAHRPALRRGDERQLLRRP